uniref:SUEL-type lectin domain-containing protein n=1 Tax=Mola mola TaxID=94237 RepID=A0A3Q4ALZ7_MOLML
RSWPDRFQPSQTCSPSPHAGAKPEPEQCSLKGHYLCVLSVFSEHHRTRLVCENERLRLMCKNDTVLMIYSATFGHLLHGSPSKARNITLKTDKKFQFDQTLFIPECLSPSALRKVSRRCHGRANCSVLADTLTFGDPCFSGVRKHLRVSFTCENIYKKPPKILNQILLADQIKISLDQNDGKRKVCRRKGAAGDPKH